MKRIAFLLFLLSFGIQLTGFSQAELDSILLLNGKVFRVDITEVSEDYILFREKDKKGEYFNGQMERYRVFSYTREGKDVVVYRQDELQNDFLSVPDAKNATLGSYDARQNFKPRFVFWSSLALGYGASLYDTYLTQSSIDAPNYIGDQTEPGFFKRKPSLAPVLVPVLLPIAWSFPSFKIKPNQIIQKDLINNENYYRGFHRVAKQKRMLGALKGSLIGIGAGLLTYGIANL